MSIEKKNSPKNTKSGRKELEDYCLKTLNLNPPKSTTSEQRQLTCPTGIAQNTNQTTTTTTTKDSETYSVPFKRSIRNCSGDRIARHSSSGFCTDRDDAITTQTLRKCGTMGKGDAFDFEALLNNLKDRARTGIRVATSAFIGVALRSAFLENNWWATPISPHLILICVVTFYMGQVSPPPPTLLEIK